MSIDWSRLEEVIERVMRRVRTEEFREVAEALKVLADYMRVGFQEVNKRLEEHTKILEEHTKILMEHGRRLEELTKAVGELKVAMGFIGRRWGKDLESTVFELYRHALEERGIEPGKVERFVYTDVDGRYYRPGARLEVDVYIHDSKATLIEVKSHAELDNIEWFFEKARIVERILGRKADKLLMVAVNIDEEALKRARELGIDVIYGSIIK